MSKKCGTQPRPGIGVRLPQLLARTRSTVATWGPGLTRLPQSRAYTAIPPQPTQRGLPNRRPSEALSRTCKYLLGRGVQRQDSRHFEGLLLPWSCSAFGRLDAHMSWPVPSHTKVRRFGRLLRWKHVYEQKGGKHGLSVRALAGLQEAKQREAAHMFVLRRIRPGEGRRQLSPHI